MYDTWVSIEFVCLYILVYICMCDWFRLSRSNNNQQLWQISLSPYILEQRKEATIECNQNKRIRCHLHSWTPLGWLPWSKQEWDFVRIFVWETETLSPMSFSDFFSFLYQWFSFLFQWFFSHSSFNDFHLTFDITIDFISGSWLKTIKEKERSSQTN